MGVSGIFGEFYASAPNLGLYDDINELSLPYDFLFLTTKSYDTSSAMEDLSRIEDSKCVYVSLQNGCGNVEQLTKRFSHGRSLGGRVITGFEITEPGVVAITVSADAIHIGSSRAGEKSASAQLLAETITEAGHPCIAVEDIHQSLYAKLLYNCTLNPLGAILGVNYGLLGAKVETRTLMNEIIEETFKVIKAHGGTTSWHTPQGVQRCLLQDPPAGNLQPSAINAAGSGEQKTNGDRCPDRICG